MLEKAKQLQIEKDIKEKEAKRLALEKTQIEALIAKHKPHTPKTPDEVNTLGTGKNANRDGKEGTKKGKPPHKKATKASQIKTSQYKGDKANISNLDTLLGDPMVNTKKGTYKTNEKGAKPKQTRGRGKPKGKPQDHRQNPPNAQEADETYTYDSPNNYYHNDNYTAPSQNHGHRPFNGQGGNQ